MTFVGRQCLHNRAKRLSRNPDGTHSLYGIVTQYFTEAPMALGWIASVTHTTV